MYSNPENFNKLKNAFFKTFSLKSTKCLEPTETCCEPLIDSHSIQDSRILEKLATDNHVIHITFDKSCVSKSTINNLIEPTCKYESISMHKASVFIGLCNKHDTELFRPIDTEDLDMDNKEHIFLLTYRSVLKELSSSLSAATMNQSMFQSKVELGETTGDSFTLDGLLPVLFFERAYIFYQYKKLFDEDYLSKNYDNIVWKYIILDNVPTFATSTVFTPVEMATNEDEPERLCVNVFPYKDKMHVVFSCRKEDEKSLNHYIEEVFSATGEYQKYLISKIVLRNCENTVFSPNYFAQWSEEKKETILEYFKNTYNSDLIGYENPNLYLF